MSSDTRPRRKHEGTILLQPSERTLRSNMQTTFDEASSVGYFIILVGLVLSLIAIPFNMTTLLIGSLFVAVFGVTLMVVTDTV